MTSFAWIQVQMSRTGGIGKVSVGQKMRSFPRIQPPAHEKARGKNQSPER
jgi:hypothetical protein